MGVGNGVCEEVDGEVKCDGKGESDWLTALFLLVDEIVQKFLEHPTIQELKNRKFITTSSPLCSASVNVSSFTLEFDFCRYEPQLMTVGNLLLGLCLISSVILVIRGF